MSNPRMEILRMIAEGRMSPEDGDRLLEVLSRNPSSEPGDSRGEPGSGTGNPSGSSSGTTGAGSGSSGAGARSGAGAPGSSGRESGSGSSSRGFSEGLGRAFEEAAAAVKAAATEGMKAVHSVFDEHRPGTVPVPLSGNQFEIPPGATLRIQPALRVSMSGGSAGSGVVVRTTQGSFVRVLRGAAVEVHRFENEFVVSWAKQTLEIEVPEHVAQLVARGIGGHVGVYGFPGMLRIEALGGGVTVEDVRAPFKISSVGGPVRVTGLAISYGASSISATGGDVILIRPQEEASVEVRATSSFGGGLELPRGAAIVTGRTRQRGTFLLGDGEARLRIDSVAGWIRARGEETAHHTAETDHEETKREDSSSAPPPPPRDVRDAAGEAMVDPREP